MEVVLPKSSIKALAAAIACVGKIGKELLFEATADALVLRAINDAKNAFIWFTIPSSCFEAYRPPPPGAASKCQVLIKSCQHVFRSTKNVTSLKLYFEEADGNHYFVFQFVCNNGIFKIHRVFCNDCDVLHAIFDRTGRYHKLAAKPGFLMQVSENVHGTPEITINAGAVRVSFDSFHIEGDDDGSSEAKLHTIRTATGVSRQEFDRYDMLEDGSCEITFALKEFRAMLSFCQAVDLELVTALFSSAGKPVLFTTEGGGSGGLTVDLVLATVQGGGADSVITGSLSQDEEKHYEMQPTSRSDADPMTQAAKRRRTVAVTPGASAGSQSSMELSGRYDAAASTAADPDASMEPEYVDASQEMDEDM